MCWGDVAAMLPFGRKIKRGLWGRRWRKRAGAAVARADGRQKTRLRHLLQILTNVLHGLFFTFCLQLLPPAVTHTAQRPFIHLQDTGVAIR